MYVCHVQFVSRGNGTLIRHEDAVRWQVSAAEATCATEATYETEATVHSRSC
jgi:hypothetical protein